VAGVTSEAQLSSISLLRIGQKQTINSLDDRSASAQACKALFANARDSLLETLDWPFARRRATLAATTLTRSEWSFVYSLPTNCLAPRWITTGLQAADADTKIPFAIEGDDSVGTNRVLLTDQDDAELVFTAGGPNAGNPGQAWPPALMPPLFVDALAWKLACDLTLALPVKPGTLELMEKRFAIALGAAAAASRNQQRDPKLPTPRFIKARE
jgi:hypothetical protein